MFAILLSIYLVSQRHIHLCPAWLLGLEGFLTLWSDFLHHICEVYATLEISRGHRLCCSGHMGCC